MLLPCWLWFCCTQSFRFCGAWDFPRCFCYDTTTTRKIWQSLVYADSDAASTLLWPRRWCYASVELLYLCYIKSEIQLIYVQLNVNIQKKWIGTLKSLCFSWPIWTTDLVCWMMKTRQGGGKGQKGSGSVHAYPQTEDYNLGTMTN